MTIKQVLELEIKQTTSGDGVLKITGDLRKVQDELSNTEKEIAKGSSSTSSFTDNWSMMLLGVNQGISILRQAGQAVQAAFDFTYEGAQISQTEAAFESMMSTIDMGPEILNSWQDASDGVISDLDLMTGFQTAAAGTSRDLTRAFAENNTELLEISKAASALNPALGDTAYMYESITRGIKRASPMILDNLGIVVKVEEANENLAAQLGKTVEELTAEEKQIALLNEVLERGDTLVNQLGGSVESATDPWDQFTTAIQNNRDAQKEAAAENGFFQKTLSGMTEVLNRGAENVERLANEQRTLDSLLERGIINQKEYNRLLREAEYGGENVAGVYTGMSDAQRELNYYTNVNTTQTSEYGDEMSDLGGDIQGVTEEMENYTTSLEKAYEEATSIPSNFRSIISLAESYDDILDDISDKQGRINQLMKIMHSGGYIDGVWVSASKAQEEIGNLQGEIDELQIKMEEMANQVVLDMFEATLAIGGFTQDEVEAYFQMADELGIISSEASQAAIDAWRNAQSYIDSNPLNARVNDSELQALVDDINRINGSNITVYANITPRGSGIGAGQTGPQQGYTGYSRNATGSTGGSGDSNPPPQWEAEGDYVIPGQRVVVGELGPEELVIQQPGKIISNRDIQNGNAGGPTINYYGPAYFRTEQETRALIERVLMEAAR